MVLWNIASKPCSWVIGLCDGFFCGKWLTLMFTCTLNQAWLAHQSRVRLQRQRLTTPQEEDVTTATAVLRSQRNVADERESWATSRPRWRVSVASSTSSRKHGDFSPLNNWKTDCPSSSGFQNTGNERNQLLNDPRVWHDPLLFVKWCGSLFLNLWHFNEILL